MSNKKQSDNIELDIERRRLYRNGEAQHLSPQCWEVLELLDKRAGHVVTFDELIRIVWNDTVENDSVEQSISHIRKALGMAKTGQRYSRQPPTKYVYWVETVPKKGFVFWKPVAQPVRQYPTPFQQADFVQRNRQEDSRSYLEYLEEAFTNSKQPKVMTLWGRMGVGKTTVAFQLRNRLKDTHGFKCVWSSARNGNYYFDTLLRDVVREFSPISDSQIPPMANLNFVLHLLRETTAPCLIILDDIDKMDSEEESLCLDWITSLECCSALITSNHKTNLNDIQLEEMTDDEAEEFVSRLIALKIPNSGVSYSAQKIIKALGTKSPLLLEDGVKWLGFGFDLNFISKKVFASQGGKDDHVKLINRLNGLRQQIGEDAYNLSDVLFRLFDKDALLEAVREVSGLSGDDGRFEEALSMLVRYGLVNLTPGRVALLEQERHLREKIVESKQVKRVRGEWER